MNIGYSFKQQRSKVKAFKKNLKHERKIVSANEVAPVKWKTNATEESWERLLV